VKKFHYMKMRIKMKLLMCNIDTYSI
jgi:hypothetical protein